MHYCELCDKLNGECNDLRVQESRESLFIMRYLNILYKGYENLTKTLERSGFQNERNCLVRIHTSSLNTSFAMELARRVKQLMPNANIIGCATSGVVYEGQIYTADTLISITSFENARVFSDIRSLNDENKGEVAHDISDSVNGFGATTSFLFLTCIGMPVTRMIRDLEELSPQTSFVGGLAGYSDENTGDIATYVFNDKVCYECGYVVGGVSKDYALSYMNTIVGHDPISDTHVISKMNHSYVEEIDGKESLQWLKNQLGLKELTENNQWHDTVQSDILLRIPFVLDGEEGASRFLQYEHETNKLMLYFSELPEGQKFQMGYLSTVASLSEWQNAYIDLQNTSVEYIFTYSCLFRRMYLDNLSEVELRPFAEAGVAGAFMLGEFGTKNGVSRFYNGTCCIVTFAEKENYIKIAFHNAESLSNIQNKQNLKLDFTEFKQNIDANRETLIHRIESREEVTTRMFFDTNLEVAKTMSEFVLERFQNDTSKLCLVTNYILGIDNSRVNDIEKRKISDELIELCKDYLEKVSGNLQFDFYRFTQDSFFFIIRGEKNGVKIIELTKSLYAYLNIEVCRYKLYNIYNLVTIALEVAKTENLLASQPKPSIDGYKNCFHIYNVEDTMSPLQSEFELVSTLKSIIQTQFIVPYIQGIYDNKNGEFVGYEAIMRLITGNGEVLFPEHFFDVAKKYGLYLELNYILVSKVLDYVSSRGEVVFIGLCKQDLLSESFIEMVTTKLEQLKTPSKTVFEISDMEAFVDGQELEEAIGRFAKLGVKFAVDSTDIKYMEQIENTKLNVDFVKIRSKDFMNILNDGVTRTRLFTFAKKMHSEIIVKNVESATMQKSVIENSVRYTQGSFFSTPVPLEESFSLFETSETNKAYEEQSEERTYERNNRILQKISFVGMVFIILCAFIGSWVFINRSYDVVEQMNDEFLMELATSLSHQVSGTTEQSINELILVSDSVVLNGYDEETIIENLSIYDNKTLYDDIYVSYNNGTPVNALGMELVIDWSLDTELEPLYSESTDEWIQVLSSAVEHNSQEEVICMVRTLENEEGDVIQVFGVCYKSTYLQALDIETFGGQAFVHLCEVDGSAIIISGDNNNLFMGGDMYDFIDTFDFTNDLTTGIVKTEMEAGNATLLKYQLNGQERTAVMIPIANTEWCIISIVVNATVIGLANTMSEMAFIFAIVMLLIFMGYIILVRIIEGKYSKELLNSLEMSKRLAHSLKTNMEMDTLTRVYSRVAAEEKISNAITKESLYGRSVLVFVDVDNFKSINDTYGHKTGDIYLQEVSSAMKSNKRSNDIIGRLGGDEFVMLLTSVESKDALRLILDRVLESVCAIEIKGVSLDEVSISAGILLVPRGGGSYNDLSQKADSALYLAKLAGKNKYVFYDEINN